MRHVLGLLLLTGLTASASADPHLVRLTRIPPGTRMGLGPVRNVTHPGIMLPTYEHIVGKNVYREVRKPYYNISPEGVRIPVSPYSRNYNPARATWYRVQ
jgi:hypothetical protein